MCNLLTLDNAITEFNPWVNRLEREFKSNVKELNIESHLIKGVSSFNGWLYYELDENTIQSKNYFRTIWLHTEFTYEIQNVLDDAIDDDTGMAFTKLQEHCKLELLSNKLLTSLRDWRSSLELELESNEKELKIQSA